MVNYITSVGIQQVSITIASGSLTGTATITAVGSGAFIVFQGFTGTETTTQLDDDYARIELTNSTTVTATRGVTGSSQTVTINAVIIDGNTTNLIKSVQSGTITVASASASNTATISAVTNTNTAVFYLGVTANASDISLTNTEFVLSLSGTTLTATRQSGAALQVIVGYCVVEFQGSALNSSVQNVAYVSTPGAGVVTENVTIASVTTANTFLSYSGSSCSLAGSANIGRMYAQLTAATTVAISWNTASTTRVRNFNLCVIEFVSGVLAQAVQRGTIALAAATSGTATITSSATSSTLVNWLNNSTSASSNSNVTCCRITQTNATTITENVNSSATGTGSYEAVQFTPFSAGGTFNPGWATGATRIIGGAF